MTKSDAVEMHELEQEIKDLTHTKKLQYQEINKRLDALENIIIAHQSWTVLQKGERQCHLSARNLIESIRKIMNNGS